MRYLLHFPIWNQAVGIEQSVEILSNFLQESCIKLSVNSQSAPCKAFAWRFCAILYLPWRTALTSQTGTSRSVCAKILCSRASPSLTAASPRPCCRLTPCLPLRSPLSLLSLPVRPSLSVQVAHNRYDVLPPPPISNDDEFWEDYALPLPSERAPLPMTSMLEGW